MSDDEWQLPVPKEDPEARPASLDGDGGGGCPFTPGGETVKRGMTDEEWNALGQDL